GTFCLLRGVLQSGCRGMLASAVAAGSASGLWRRRFHSAVDALRQALLFFRRYQLGGISRTIGILLLMCTPAGAELAK
ncbi:MAG: hypothetical protein RID07_17080, partial [Lacipirellulaceae bacterium]